MYKRQELIYRTISQLYRRGATVLYDRIAKVHVSGHASREEIDVYKRQEWPPGGAR